MFYLYLPLRFAFICVHLQTLKKIFYEDLRSVFTAP